MAASADEKRKINLVRAVCDVGTRLVLKLLLAIGYHSFLLLSPKI
jgi:hypothetical protein